MALNFPPNPGDKTVYIDPSSGLKYLYNGSIGAWETALQPPVITSTDERPLIRLEGFLWWNHKESMLYVYKGGNWIPIMGEGGSGGRDTPVYIEVTPPPNPEEGWLWWDPVGGQLYVYYVQDPVLPETEYRGQWVKCVTTDGGTYTARSINSDIAPLNPVDGQMWFNSSINELFIYDKRSEIWQPAVKDVSSSLAVIEPLFMVDIEGVNTLYARRATELQTGYTEFADSNLDTIDLTSPNKCTSPLYINNRLSMFREEIIRAIPDEIYDEIKEDVLDHVWDAVASSLKAEIYAEIESRLENYVPKNFNDLNNKSQ